MSAVSIERTPPLRFVKLDTGKKNVLTLEAVEALKDAIAPDSEAPVVVFSGRQDGFCCGLDNATLAKGKLDREELLTSMGELLLQAIEGPTRIVAVCEGHAVAAGAMLLLVADVRLGTPGTHKIGFTEPRIGMPLPVLPAMLARERLDRRRLHELTVLGQVVDPERAAEVGFLDRLVATEDVGRLATQAAHEIAALSDSAYCGSVTSLWGDTVERMRSLVEEQSHRLRSLREGAR